jgi:hypothetical protein
MMKDLYLYINANNLKNDSYKFAFLIVLKYYMTKNEFMKNFNIKTIFNLKNINKNSIVIPIGVECNYELFRHKYNFNVNEMFDDKLLFYKYLEQNNDLLDNIKLIKSYNSHKCENILKEFYIKPKNGKGGDDNHVEKDYIINILKKYDKKVYQIQDKIEFKYIYAVNCSCIDGNIIGLFVSKTNDKIDFSKKYKKYIKNKINIKIINNFITKILKRIKYNGFIEFEFIIDINNNIYIMECNPRITGQMFIKEYFDILIVPYIKYIDNKCHKKINNIQLNKLVYLDNVYVNITKIIILLIYEIIKKKMIFSL